MMNADDQMEGSLMRDSYIVPVWRADSLREILLLIGILLFMNFFGNRLGLFNFPSLGFDKMLHFFAGYICGRIVILSLSRLSYNYFCDARTFNFRLLFLAVSFAAAIGGGWEILQTYFPLLRKTLFVDRWDTLGDIIFGIVGAVVAAKQYKKNIYF